MVAGEADMIMYDGLASLPHFNPDCDTEPLNAAVANFREQVASSDAVVISTPEYAHGLPGTFKNALDWLVSDSRFVGKLVVIVTVDRGSTWAVDSLHETLRTMSAEVLRDASLRLRLGTNDVSSEGLLRRPEIAGALGDSARQLLAACRRRRKA